jgi:hypothetical protein
LLADELIASAITNQSVRRLQTGWQTADLHNIAVITAVDDELQCSQEGLSLDPVTQAPLEWIHSQNARHAVHPANNK